MTTGLLARHVDVVVLLAVLGLGVLGGLGSVGAAAVRHHAAGRELRQRQVELTGFRHAVPPVSKELAAGALAARQQLEEVLGEIGAAVQRRGAGMEAVPGSPLELKDRVLEAQRRIAREARQTGVVLGSPELGFGEFAREIPPAERVPDLAVRLAAIEHVMEVVLAAGVTRVEEIALGPDRPGPVAVEGGALYQELAFHIRVVGPTRGLLATLHGVQELPAIVVVDGVSLESSEADDGTVTATLWLTALRVL